MKTKKAKKSKSQNQIEIDFECAISSSNTIESQVTSNDVKGRIISLCDPNEIYSVLLSNILNRRME